MDSLIIEGVRCFSEPQSVRLRPITLLTGENSTGKSTVLAMARIAWDICAGQRVLDFNEEPFVLGEYDEIASYRGGRVGRAKSFTVTSKFLSASRTRSLTVVGRFIKRGSQPVLHEWTLKWVDSSLKVVFGEDDGKPQWHLETPSGTGVLAASFLAERSFTVFSLLSILRFYEGRERLPGSVKKEGAFPTAREANRAMDAYRTAARTLRPYAFAPIRTRPKRTYDPLRDVPEPEGSHVPMILAKLSSSDPEGWRRLQTTLDSFGKASGLFRDVEVRHMRRTEGGPFQIRVSVSGLAFNLVDVGYGVSQVLPLVVDMLRGPAGSTFELQQPEVHLHPRAQAELGSLFATLAKEQGKRFLIETHSDHLVDRLRMEVREGKLKPADVSLLYFERRRRGVKIHEIELDTMGNIVKPPRGYRQFFLDEERHLLGI